MVDCVYVNVENRSTFTFTPDASYIVSILLTSVTLSNYTGRYAKTFLAQHTVQILEQHCNHSKQHRKNDATLVTLKIVVANRLV